MMNRFALLPVIAFAAACSSDTITPTGPHPARLPAPQAAIVATVDFAAAPSGAHFAKGESAPLCTLSGGTASCTSSAIQGVGNTNAVASLAVTATFTGVCHNPGVNNKVVEPFSEAQTNETSVPLTPSRNGRLDVLALSASVPSIEQFTAGFTCPNANWEADVSGSSISFTYSLTFAGFNTPVILITGP